MDRLSRRRHWIFDLDGTLTIKTQDFHQLRRQLGMPEGAPVLEWIVTRPEEEAARLLAEVAAWEGMHAARARPAPGAKGLLAQLQRRGCRLGILTRNRRDLALTTLAGCALVEYFDADDVLGRDEAEAKPSPEGLLRLLHRWRAAPEDAVMVGDYLHDMAAGRAARVATVLVAPARPAGWPTDLVVADLEVLAAALGAQPAKV